MEKNPILIFASLAIPVTIQEKKLFRLQMMTGFGYIVVRYEILFLA